MSNIVTFEQAVRLRNLGYNIWSQFSYYKTDITFQKTPKKFTSDYNVAPTVSDALDWIREEKHTPCYVDAGYCHQYDTVGYWGVILSDFGYIKRVQTETSPTHPLAESALLTAVLEYLIEKEK